MPGEVALPSDSREQLCLPLKPMEVGKSGGELPEMTGLKEKQTRFVVGVSTWPSGPYSLAVAVSSLFPATSTQPSLKEPQDLVCLRRVQAEGT